MARQRLNAHAGDGYPGTFKNAFKLTTRIFSLPAAPVYQPLVTRFCYRVGCRKIALQFRVNLNTRHDNRGQTETHTLSLAMSCYLLVAGLCVLG